MTLNAGTSPLLFSSTVGNLIPLSYLISLGTGAATATGNITTVANQLYSSAMNLAADITFTTTNSPINFTSTIDGAHSLVATTGSGTILVGSAIGGVTPLHQVTLTGNGGISINAITTTSAMAAVTLNSVAGILVNGNIHTAAGNGTVTANGNVVLNTNVLITTAASAVTINGNVNGAISNAESLSIDTANGGGSPTGASVAINGNIGFINSLTSLNITAGTTGTIALGNIGGVSAGITSGLTLNSSAPGTAIFLNGGIYNTSGGAQHFTGNVQLGITTTLTSTGGNIVFDDKIDGIASGAQSLVLDAGAGSATLSGLVGSSNPLSFLVVNALGGINIDNGGITTSNNQSYNGPVLLGADALFATTNSPITFASTIDGAHSLVATTGSGTILVGSSIGGIAPLHQVTLTGNGIISIDAVTTTSAAAAVSLNSITGILIGGNINTATGIGAVTANGNVTLNTNALITTAASAVTINGNVDGATSSTENLGIDTTNGGSNPTGASVTINGNIGFNNSLAGLSITVGTTGTITLGNIGGSNVGVTSGLTLNSSAPGTAIFLNGGIYNTSGGAQHFTGNVQLGITTTLTSTGGNIVFDDKIDGIVSGAQSLVLDAGAGSATLSGLVGSTTSLSFLTVDASGGINIDNGGITTLNNQNYNGPVLLGADATFKTTNSPVIFASTVNGNAIGRNLNIDAVNGPILISGAIGSTGTAFGTITMVGNGGITLNGIGTGAPGLGAVNISAIGGISLRGGTYNALSQNYTGQVILGATTAMASAPGQNITVTGLINGDGVLTYDLTMTTPGGGNSTITGSIGEIFPLGNLMITSNNITVGGIGGPNAGIIGTATLTAATDINFAGSTYYLNNPIFTTGTNFNILQTVPTNINAPVGPILFNTGSINLSNSQSSLVLTTNNADITLSKLVGISQGHLLASAGTGTITVGDAPGPTFTDFQLHAGAVVLTGPLTANSITIVSDTGISNLGGPQLLTAQDVILLDALGGDVGSLASPIQVSSTGFVICGATGEGFYTGTTGDGTVHCLPSNPPMQITFNGVMIGCQALIVCPPCISSPSEPSSSSSSRQRSKIEIPASFVAVKTFVPGSYHLFGFSLASDFFFLEDRAAACVGDYATYNSLREPDEKCTYDHMFWIAPKKSKY